MQAARVNARDLLDTARMLHDRGRFAHSTAFSILALEEAGKHQILMMLFLNIGGTRDELWQAYRRHTSKTAGLNFAIELRTRAVFPEIDPKTAQEVGEAGPDPRDLDATKQLALYSDCFGSADGPNIHLPRNLGWETEAEHRLADAHALVNYLRDYPPDELAVWARHATVATAEGRPFADVLKPLHEELVSKGFVAAGQWRPIWDYLGVDSQTRSEPSKGA